MQLWWFLPPDPPKENSSGQGGGSDPCAMTTNGGPVAGREDKAQDPHTPKLTVSKGMKSYLMN